MNVKSTKDEVKGDVMDMKKRKVTRKRGFQLIGTIGIVSIILAIVLIVVGNFTIKDKENISKADDITKVSDGTNFGKEYELADISATDINNRQEAKNNGIELLTVASSFYNYRYDNEIKKGWRDQGIDGELSGVGNPFSIFNNKLSEYYKDEDTSHNTSPNIFGLYEGNFYNYWKGTYQNYNWCLKNYHDFHWAQNIANRQGDYSAVCQGLVNSSLKDFTWNNTDFTAGSVLTNNSVTKLPFYNKEFLDQKYNDNDKIGIGVVAENVGFPFRYAHDSQKGSYYVFDSKYDVVRFSGSESGLANTYKYYYGVDDNTQAAKLNYYYKKTQVCSRQNKTSQFLPFNKPTSSNNLDFGFGLRVDIPFYLTENGCQVDADGGKPMKFNFEGDDDVWVFIDGELVLDLGGAHAKTKGSIDFSYSDGTSDNTKVKVRAEKVAYSTYDTNTKKGTTTAGTNNFESSNSSIHTSEKIVSGIAKDNVHVLTVFYMERGMIESNLYMDFNFIPHNEEVDIPTNDDTTTSITDSELTIKNIVASDNIATAFQAKINELVEDDAFQYKIENAGTRSVNVGDSGIKYPSGKLSVRDNAGKRTYWSFGQPGKLRVYFDYDSIDNASVTADSGSNKFWALAMPHVYLNNKHEPMTYWNDNYYYADIETDTLLSFTNGKQDPVKIRQDLEGKELKTALDTSSDACLGGNGDIFHVKSYNAGNGEGNGYWERWDNLDSSKQKEFPKLNTSEYSKGLPYEKIGSCINFVPQTDPSTYSPVSNTTYNFSEEHLASKDEHILKNINVTSGITDNNGTFSLLSDNSATFLKQFKKNSIMRIVQNEYLGKVNNRTETPTKTTVLQPSVTVSKDSSSFIDSFKLTLTPVNAINATYSINGGTKIHLDVAGPTTITLGKDCACDQDVTVTVSAEGVNGSTPFKKTFTYTKKYAMYLRIKKSTEINSAPNIYLYNRTAYSNTEELNGNYPGGKMTEEGDYYVYKSNTILRANVILSLGTWRSTLDGQHGLLVSGYKEYDKNTNSFTKFTTSSSTATDDTSSEIANVSVATITEGSRKTADFYYSTISTKDKNDKEITTSKTGEFKFANVDGSTDNIVINETFTNQVKTGNLCIAKEVTGMKNTSGTYSFTIKFKDVFGVSDGEYKGYALDYKKYDANNTETAGILVDSNPTVELKSGEKIIITGIPAGTKYQIIEEDTNTDASKKAVTGKISVSYDTKVNGKTQLTTNSGTEITKLETGQTGTIEGMIPTSVTNSSTSETVNEFDEVDVNVTFTNQKGVLRIEKLAIGEWKNFKNEEYTFTITGDDAINSYTYDVYEYDQETGKSQIAKEGDKELQDISITDGKIKLKATQWVLIQDIPLTEDGKNYTITETEGTYYKLDSIDVNAGVEAVSANIANGTISMKLSWTNPNADVTFVNRYDPAYITINKYVDALYYQIYNEGKTDTTDKLYSDVTGDEITYQDLTDAKQSFIFTIDEYNTKDAAKEGKREGAAYVKTFQITIPMDSKDSNIKLTTPVKYTVQGKEEHTYRYESSKTIKLTLGRFYRISEDTNWSWKYNLQGIETVFSDTTGTVHKNEDNCIVFEGGTDAKIPKINFYNTLTEDETKLSTDGDTDVVVNIIKPDN